MIRPLECFIGLRYLGTVGGRGLVSFMSFASLAGIALGVAALIVILSAMNGLEAESRSRLLSLAEHITVRAGDPSADLGTIAGRLAAVDGVAAVTPFVQFEAMLRTRTGTRPVLVRGIDPVAAASDAEMLRILGADGLAQLVPGTNRLLLGRFAAAGLGVLPSDPVELLVASARDGRVVPARFGFSFANAFNAGVEAFDSRLALTHVADAARLTGRGSGVDALAIRLDDALRVGPVMQALQAELGPGYVWSNWALENRSLYKAMAIEKAMMTIVLLFIVAVAAFNIVASLMMVVNEKAKDIAILRTLGLEPERVMRIFLVQGAVLGAGGTLAGVVAGLALAFNLQTILPWLERTFGFQIMPGDVFYVNYVPSEIRLPDVLLIPGLTLLIALLATLYPSRRAAAIEPAEVLRYE